ncbi:MAG: soluble NSF attachment family protein [Acidobacteriota bacterium]|nr:soluble NSF attachment family protein [Acidobacteriota bacterium]
MSRTRRHRARDIAEMLDVGRRVAAEQAQAKSVVHSLTKAALDQLSQADVPSEWRTVGMAIELARAASAASYVDLDLASALAHFSLAAATTVPREKYTEATIASAEAEAWKEVANAAQHLGDYEGALRALDAADKVVEPYPGLAMDRISLAFARGILYSHTNRLDEAAVLLDRCAKDFMRLGEADRVADCMWLRGNIAARRRDFANAERAYKVAANRFETRGSLRSLAIVRSNRGQALAELQRYDEASREFMLALPIFENLQIDVEAARSRAALACLMLSTGRFAEARASLSSARSRLLDLKLVEEAGIVGLYLADAHLAFGDVAAARAIVEQVLRESREIRLHAATLTAIAYLDDLLRTPIATEVAMRHLRHVRAFAKAASESRPTRLFLPLEDA